MVWLQGLQQRGLSKGRPLILKISRQHSSGTKLKASWMDTHGIEDQITLNFNKCLLTKKRNKYIIFEIGQKNFNVFKDFIFLDRGEGRERNITVWLPLTCPLLRTWPATQACPLTGNWTSNPLIGRLAFYPLSHTSEGIFFNFLTFFI